MKKIILDLGFVIDMDYSLGSLQICSILGKEDSTKMLVENFTNRMETDIASYQANHLNNPIMKEQTQKDVELWFKGYKKKIRNAKKHKIPSWLMIYYEKMIDDVNDFIQDCNSKGFNLKVFKK